LKITVRLVFAHAGTFLYNNSNSDFLALLDRPPIIYLTIMYGNLSGFSQQLILAEGGFKSKLNMPYANQWMTTLNGGYTIWNWIELYGDAGLLKTAKRKVCI
jgi:hypothetical protein